MSSKIFLSAIVLLFLAYNADSVNENDEKLTLSNAQLELVKSASRDVSELLEKGLPEELGKGLNWRERKYFKKQIATIKKQSAKSKGGIGADSNANMVSKKSLADLKELLGKVRNALKAIVEKKTINYNEVYSQKLAEMKKCEMDENKRKEGGNAVGNSEQTNSGAQEESSVSMPPAVSDVKDEYVKLIATMSMLKKGKGCKNGAKMDADDDEEEGVPGKRSFWKGCCAALCCCCLLDACF